MGRTFDATASGVSRARNALLITDPNRLISYGRLITAIFAVIAIYLDPTQPSRYRAEVQDVLAIYLVMAIVLVAVPIRRPVDSPVHFLVHVLDTAILGWLAFLTNELTSPFFSFLPFTLLAMTVRWGFMGAMIGAVMLEVVLFTIGIPDILDGESELNVLIIRTVYFLVCAVMLGYFGAYRESSRERLARLAGWPMDAGVGDRRGWLAELCGHSGAITGCESLILIWREQDEPTGFIAHWRKEGLRLLPLDPATFRSVFAEARLDFMDRTRASLVSPAEMSGLTLALDALGLPRPLPHDYAVRSGFSGLRFRGAMIVVDPDGRPEDALALTEIIAARTGSELEHVELVARRADSARAEERSRLGQDLHDSVLQDLTATSLKLRSLAAREPDVAQDLKAIEELLTEQQRRIRRFVEEQRDVYADQPTDMVADLRRQADLLEKKWGVTVAFDWHGRSTHLPRNLVEEVIALFSEATANAVRHGSATRVALEARRVGSALELGVVDNGRGLGPAANGIGPVSLRSRAMQLGGSIALNDSADGLRVTMVIPLDEAA
jgi:signal transduction histidine kinase